MFTSEKNTKQKKAPKTCVAIVPAAGSSSRMGALGNKLFSIIDDVPVIVKALSALEAAPSVSSIIIPTREDMIDEIKALCEAHSLHKVSDIIAGGKTRAESVLCGMQKAKKKGFDLVAVHDAARPFVSNEIIEKTISTAARYSASAPAVPVKDTIKSAVGGIVEKTVPRETLFAIQTPQVFDFDLLFSALTKAVSENLPITDDCSAVELIGMKIVLTKGDYFNIKITTPEDLLFAEAISKAKAKEDFK